MYSVVTIYLLLLYGTPVSLNQPRPQVPWGAQSPTLCSVSLSSFPCVSACYVLLLTYIGHVTCGTPLPSLLPLPPLSLECANLYHSHHFLSFCMLHFAVLAYYNLQNTTNPSPTPIPWGVFTSITLIISLCFCKLCYAVNVTCNMTLPLPPPPSHFPEVCSLLSLPSFPSLYFCKLCYAVSETCNMTLPPPSPTPPQFPRVCSLLSLSYAVSVT